MLRVSAMAHDPQTVKIEVRLADVVALLAAVDRLAHPIRVESLTVVNGEIPGAFLAGSMTVYNNDHRKTRFGRR